MEHSNNKDLQARFLNRLSSSEGFEFIKEHNTNVTKFWAGTKDMFANNVLICAENINTLYDYGTFKANLFCNASSSQSEYLKTIKFFEQIERTDLSNQEKILLSVVFFSRSSNEGDIVSYLSAALEIKEQLGEGVFVKLYKDTSKSASLYDYIISSQLLVVVNKEIDVGGLISKYEDNLPELKTELEAYYSKQSSGKNKESENDIDNLISKFAGVEYPLSESELSTAGVKYKKLASYGEVYQKMSLMQLTTEGIKESELLKVGKLDSDCDIKLLAILREAIKHEFDIYPYNTQMMVVLSLLQDKEEYKGRLAEVLTGEGKSTIITLLCGYLALSGKHVDIITSSGDLAIRDQKKYAHFFKLFNIRSSHISYPDPDPKHFNAQIIYGTNYDFEFAVLRTKIYDKKLFIEKDRIVIVDEVDNLFIDTALNSARIAYPAPRDMSWIYEPILNYVKNSLVFITVSGLKEHLKTHNLKEFNAIEEHLTLEYLRTLINSAQVALEKKLDHDYVVRFDDKEGKQKVIIVDILNTGRLNHGSRWSAGIHEFVEVLNGLKPEPESLTVASISHPSFFGLYSKIYGLTGTIGEAEERAEVKSVYDVDFFDVPPHFPSKKTGLVTKFINIPGGHYKKIIASIKEQVAKGRPVLVLFKPIEETNEFSKLLTQNKLSHNVLNEVQETNEQYILSSAGRASGITIATNAAGRGTDIILSKDSIDRGGLLVIVTFLPNNLRVEEQACGRGGRQGQPGSCEMIISINDPGVVSIKYQLSKTTEDQAIKKIMESRSKQVKALSQYRVARAESEKEIYEILNKFTNNLDIIRKTLEGYDGNKATHKYHYYASANQTDSCPGKNSVMDNLYKQGSRLIAHQVRGNWVEWGSFVNEAKDKYITALLQQWAQFFSRIDKAHRADDTKISDLYTQFYELSIKKQVEEPIKYFSNFVDGVVDISSSYASCMNNNFSETTNQNNENINGATANIEGLDVDVSKLLKSSFIFYELNQAATAGTLRAKLLGREKGDEHNLLYFKVEDGDLDYIKGILDVVEANDLLKDLLLDKGMDGDTALNKALSDGNKEIVTAIFKKLFTASNLPILKEALLVNNDYDISPLHNLVMASKEIFQEIMELASKKGALETLLIPEAGKSTALHFAVYEEKTDVIKVILEASAKAGFLEATLLARGTAWAGSLYLAIETKNVEVVKAVIEVSDADILEKMFSAKYWGGNTVLHSAKAAGEEVMKAVYEKVLGNKELLPTLTILNEYGDSALGKLVLTDKGLFQEIIKIAKDKRVLKELLALTVTVEVEENGVDVTKQYNLLELAQYEEKADIAAIIEEKMSLVAKDITSSTDEEQVLAAGEVKAVDTDIADRDGTNADHLEIDISGVVNYGQNDSYS